MKWLFFLLPFCLLAQEPFFAHFDAPEGWQIADPSKYGRGVKIGFIASKRKIFTPSITLTFEKVGKTSLEEYLKVIEKQNRKNNYTELGSLQTKNGLAHLIQLDIKNQWGVIRVLQAISIYEGYAMIHAASMLKEEFLSVHKELLASFKSLEVSPIWSDPLLEKKLESLTKCWKKYCATSKGDRKTLFATPFFQNNQWKPFVNYVEKELKLKGNCWQLLAIKYIQQSLLESEPIHKL